MPTIAHKMDERIQLRASNDEKALLKLAAEAAGFRNLTTFIMNTMINESKRILRTEGQKILSERDSAIILNSLINAPEPNEHLKKLLKIK
jgi:uncharacterized protein (DUF1778 family)